MTMLSKSIFPGKECKPGDILKVEVVSVQGDQVAVKASKGGYDETEEPEEIEEEETEDEGESEMMGESMSPMAGAMPPQSGEGMYS